MMKYPNDTFLRYSHQVTHDCKWPKLVDINHHKKTNEDVLRGSNADKTKNIYIKKSLKYFLTLKVQRIKCSNKVQTYKEQR